ncbi:hypothetical protein R6Q59_020173, partial [Mikania micrantha]
MDGSKHKIIPRLTIPMHQVVKRKPKGECRMGFTKLLSFNLDGIPSRLAHFVVDRLKPKKMEIVCRGGTLNITPGLIHKLWGIPNGGIQVESIVPLETYDASVSEWRAQFE